MISRVLLTFLELFVAAFNLLLLLRVAASWIQPDLTSSPWTRWLYFVTEPLLSPLRRAMPSMSGIDLSPIVAFFVLQLLLSAAQRLL